MADAPKELKYAGGRTTIIDSKTSPHASTSVVIAKVEGGKRDYLVANARPDGTMTDIDDQLDDEATARDAFNKRHLP